MLSKDVVSIIMVDVLDSLGDSELEQFLRPYCKVFRNAAIRELLRRSNLSWKAGEYLIRILTYHMGHRTIASLKLPIPLLYESLKHPFIKPKLAVLLHGCIGISQNKLPNKSQQFLEVVSHLTRDALPHIFLVQVSCDKTLVNALFERCIAMPDDMFMLESLLMSAQFFDGNQKSRLKNLLTADRIVQLRSRFLLNIALLHVDNSVRFASQKLHIRTQYIGIRSDSEGKCSTFEGRQSKYLAKKHFISSYWGYATPRYKCVMLEQLIARLYNSADIKYALREIATVSPILEEEYIDKVQREVCNYNLIFPVKYKDVGRQGEGGVIIFRDILPTVWKFLSVAQKDECLALVLVWIQVRHFQSSDSSLSALRTFLNELDTRQVSKLFESLMNLVESYEDNGISVSFDELTIGVKLTLGVLQDYLQHSDHGRLYGELFRWLKSSDARYNILSILVLEDVYGSFERGQQKVLTNLLAQSTQSKDKNVLAYGCILLNEIAPDILVGETALQCLEYFIDIYDSLKPEKVSRKMLGHLSDFYLMLTPSVKPSLIEKLIKKINRKYLFSSDGALAILSRVYMLIDSESRQEYVRIMAEHISNEIGSGNINKTNEFYKSVERIRESPIIINAIIEACNESPGCSKYLSSALRQVIVEGLPIKDAERKLTKYIKNCGGNSHNDLFNSCEFRFFSARWPDMNQEYQGRAIGLMIKKTVASIITDHAHLAILIMLWSKINDNQKEAFQKGLSSEPSELLREPR